MSDDDAERAHQLRATLADEDRQLDGLLAHGETERACAMFRTIQAHRRELNEVERRIERSAAKMPNRSAMPSKAAQEPVGDSKRPLG